MVLAVDEVPSTLYDADGVVELGELAATPPADMAGVLASVGLQTVVTDTPQPWLRALRYEHAGETYVMLVNEHPHERIDCTVKLAQGERLCGTRLDLLNGTDPVAFDGTLELAPFESCFVALETDGRLESGTARTRFQRCSPSTSTDLGPSPSPLPAAEPLAPPQGTGALMRSHGRAISPMHAGRSAIAHCSSWRTTRRCHNRPGRCLRSRDTYARWTPTGTMHLSALSLAINPLAAGTHELPSTSSTRLIKVRFPTSSPH